MGNWFYVFLGGMTGATLRFFVQSLFSSFTMLWIVNVVGSFLLGYINGVFNRKKNDAWKLFLTTGMLGAFTTFSTFSEGFFRLLRESLVEGLLFGVGMTLCCVISAWIGFRIVRGED
ncbi:Fluoride-specific ion channel FluC OS=Ureibacillus acetophenoni OX=614649 GN=fluC PE=3 SV=1 [Ureibacillus acetophenoni]